MAYKLTSQGVKRLADGTFITANNGTSEWYEYQAWLALGNTPEPEYTPEEQAVKDAADAEAAAQATLSAAAKADALFNTLKGATDAQINTYVNNQFPAFSAQQRATIKLLLMVAALTLRKGVV
ncbi:MAG: hypothetical protein EHM39_00930 [Chloroflexi bacterium]|nr:MAG: hypothetical protein EHM39_00930 [Chloroflexota bacterium]